MGSVLANGDNGANGSNPHPAKVNGVNGNHSNRTNGHTNGTHTTSGTKGTNGTNRTTGVNGHTTSKESAAFSEANKNLDFDVLIVGAGLSGIFTLHRMRQLGLRARVLEAGSGEGGTWFW